MWRMIKRTVFALSLALGVGTLALWARSYWVAEEVVREFSRLRPPPGQTGWNYFSRLSLTSSYGRLAVFASQSWDDAEIHYEGEQEEESHVRYNRGTAQPWSNPQRPSGFHVRALGFSLDAGSEVTKRRLNRSMDAPVTFVNGVPTYETTDEHGRYAAAVLPHWFLALVLGLPPLVWLSRLHSRRRRDRLRRGLCLNCGYDLRGTPGRCPECGAAGATPTGDTAVAARTPP